MPALGGVEGAEGLDGAPAKGEVEDIPMAERPHVRAEVKGCAGENRPGEGVPQMRVLLVKSALVVAIVFV
jgi:hypothetical protein